MVTIVATWNVETGESKIHLSLDSAFFDTDTRLSMAESKVEELEKLYGQAPVEIVVASSRSLDEFRKTDPRFLGV